MHPFPTFHFELDFKKTAVKAACSSFRFLCFLIAIVPKHDIGKPQRRYR